MIKQQGGCTEAITDIRKNEVSRELKDGKDLLFVLQEGNLYEDPDTGIIRREDYDFHTFETCIKEYYPNSSVVFLPEFPARNQQERFMAKTMSFNRIVMVLATKNESYRGTSDIPRRMLSLMEGLGEKLCTVILSGCPYAAREFMYVPRIICSYDGQACQRAAIEILSGKRTAHGVLPVVLKQRNILNEE